MSRMSDITVHLTHVDTEVGSADLCGETHLATGRVCALPERHAGGCQFVDRDTVLAVARRTRRDAGEQPVAVSIIVPEPHTEGQTK